MLKMTTLIALVAFTLTFISTVRAEEQACPELNTPEAILSCAFIRHPELAVSTAGLNQSVKLEGFARQFVNPSLDIKSTYGKSLGDTIANTELDLGFVLQLGGKRNARIQEAWAKQAEASAELLRTKEDVYISTFSSLIRLRQLDAEIDAIDHALEAFATIQKLYRTYGRLSPEQQISLNIFQIAHGDYRAKKTFLGMEQKRLVRNLEFILGQPVVLKDSIYPKPMSDWPKMFMNDVLNGSGIKHVQADIKQAEAEVKTAQGQSWPDVTVGPSYEQQTQGPFTYHTFGFNLSFPIPLLHINQGGRAFANAGLMRSQANLKAKESKLLAEKEILIQQYNSIVDSLKEMPSAAAIEQKHQGAEAFFRRGLLSTSLMVEYHRQIVDFIIDQNELELTGMETLWKVTALEGNLVQKN